MCHKWKEDRSDRTSMQIYSVLHENMNILLVLIDLAQRAPAGEGQSPALAGALTARWARVSIGFSSACPWETGITRSGFQCLGISKITPDFMKIILNTIFNLCEVGQVLIYCSL